MATFVLVGGFWIGAWAWRDVARRLNAVGHRAYPISLSGLGEKRPRGDTAINLETHVADVIEFIVGRDVRDAVLVGHAEAGAIVDIVAARLPEHVASLTFVDGGPVPEGRCVADYGGAGGRSEAVARSVGGFIPLPSWSEIGKERLAGLDEKNRAFLRSLSMPQPLHVAIDPVRRGGVSRSGRSKRAVLCTRRVKDVRGMIASGDPWFAPMAGSDWQFVDLPTGRWPMLSMPEKLADTIAAGHAPSRMADTTGLDWHSRRRRLALAV
jgi:pimeloyl-ACP methyl ester carboxylesterase